MVIVQFRGRLVRQYGACVVDSLGMGITCLVCATLQKRKRRHLTISSSHV